MESDHSKYYAIVPAAGTSNRMGQPKLLLPWPTKENPQGTVLDQVLQTWIESGVAAVVVVCRSDDDRLLALCERWKVDVVQPVPAPADMKASVQHALQRIASRYQPRSTDGCFVSPADLPRLQPSVIQGLIHAHGQQQHRGLLVPRMGDKRGHPVLLEWSQCSAVFQLGEDQGLDSLLSTGQVLEVPFEASLASNDIDTPGDYQRELKQARRSS